MTTPLQRTYLLLTLTLTLLILSLLILIIHLTVLSGLHLCPAFYPLTASRCDVALLESQRRTNRHTGVRHDLPSHIDCSTSIVDWPN